MATKREKIEELSPILACDVMMDILSRLPVKSIVRFKCVSKSWLTIFTHPHFVKVHWSSRSRKLNMVFTLDQPNRMRSLLVSSCGSVEAGCDIEGEGEGEVQEIDIFNCYGQEEAQVDMAGSCGGLVLCCTRPRGRLYLVNPSTREVMRLPDSPFRGSAFVSRGLGYDASGDDYKVVQIYNHSFSFSESIKKTSLYSLKSNSWRRINQHFPFIFAVSSSGVFLNGNLHWFNHDRTKMASFSLADEKFGVVTLPDLDHDNISGPFRPFQNCIGVVKGCLCILPPPGSASFWIMKQYGRRESWTKFEFADVPNCYFMKPSDFSNNDEDLFQIRNNKFVMYNLKQKTYRYVEFHNAPQYWRQAQTCLESLVSPKCYNML